MKYAIDTEIFCDDISTETAISRDIPQEWIFVATSYFLRKCVRVYVNRVR